MKVVAQEQKNYRKPSYSRRVLPELSRTVMLLRNMPNDSRSGSRTELELSYHNALVGRVIDEAYLKNKTL